MEECGQEGSTPRDALGGPRSALTFILGCGREEIVQDSRGLPGVDCRCPVKPLYCFGHSLLEIGSYYVVLAGLELIYLFTPA